MSLLTKSNLSSSSLDFSKMLECSKCIDLEKFSNEQIMRADVLQGTVRLLLDIIRSCDDCSIKLNPNKEVDYYSNAVSYLNHSIDQVVSVQTPEIDPTDTCSNIDDMDFEKYLEVTTYIDEPVKNDIEEHPKDSTTDCVMDKLKDVADNNTSLHNSELDNLIQKAFISHSEKTVVKYVGPMDIPKSLPFLYIPDTELDKFSANMLYESLSFKTIGNRKVSYFGDLPYAYGTVKHNPETVIENTYLDDIIKAIKRITPDLQFNSILVQAYEGKNSCIPPHSDDEYSICEDSQILTISLGESRKIEFKSIDKSVEFSKTLTHGSMLFMSKKSQYLYRHSIPANQGNGLRISITLRLLNNIENSPYPKENSKIHDEDVTDITNNNINYKNYRTEDLKGREEILYLSDSMFKRLKEPLLSTTKYKARVFSYSGKTSAQILEHFKNDETRKRIDPSKVSKIFILSGTNDVTKIHFNKRISDGFNALDNMFAFLHMEFPNAFIYPINLFNRNHESCNKIVSQMNNYIFNYTKQHAFMNYVDTAKNHMFTSHDGTPRTEFFWDAVHLNNRGIGRLVKFLKFIVLRGIPE